VVGCPEYYQVDEKKVEKTTEKARYGVVPKE
jgi:hypothetical protein